MQSKRILSLAIASWLTMSSSALVAAPQTLTIELTLAEQAKANYHEPYVAVWLETTERKAVSTLALWYRTKKGDKWLKDLRQWWRKAGSHHLDSIDAISGATRKAGTYQVQWSGTLLDGADISPGDYVVHIEAVREKAGREHLRLPITFPLQPGTVIRAKGDSELGNIQISINH